MITKERGKQIKKVVGYGYAKKFLKFFKEKGFTKDDGTEYTESVIRDWINGRADISPRLENFCLQGVNYFYDLYDQNKKNKERILGRLADV